MPVTGSFLSKLVWISLLQCRAACGSNSRPCATACGQQNRPYRDVISAWGFPILANELYNDDQMYLFRVYSTRCDVGKGLSVKKMVYSALNFDEKGNFRRQDSRISLLRKAKSANPASESSLFSSQV